MRTVITISLNGNAYQLDAGGYEALRAYLQVAEQRLAGNPDQKEILADLEQAIADKCLRYLGPHKNVVNAEEIAEVLREMGPVDGGAEEASQTANVAGSTAGASGATAGGADASSVSDAMGGGTMGTEGLYGSAGGTSGTGGIGSGTADASNTTGGANTGSSSAEAPRRLYQIREGAVISGVCKGLAAYLNIDVSLIRILFVVLAVLTGGVWVLVYIVMMFVIPYAQTSEQHAAAHGLPFNAEELVARAKTHYAQFRASGSKWQRRAYREQRRMWRSQHKQWKAHQRAWDSWTGAGSAPPPPPPPPPPWGTGQPPPNFSYSAQLLHGVLSPIVGILSFILLFTFIWTLVAMVRHHTFFGWWLPHAVPTWVGIVFLFVLWRAIAAPLNQAKYATYYGAPASHAWVALLGALIWLALVIFLGSLAWQHWDEVLDFLQNIGTFFENLIDQRASTPRDPWNAGLYFLAWGVPSCVLPGYVASCELESHGEIDRTDVLGEASDGDVVDSGLGDGAYSVQ